MEHLIVPSDADFAIEDRVPYVCRVEYDGGPFLTYPARHSPPPPHFIESSNNVDSPTYEKQNPTATGELESFLQTCLFFGLLREVLGDYFRTEDFIEISTTQQELRVSEICEHVKTEVFPLSRFVTTKLLVSRIDDWNKVVKRTGERQILKRHKHISGCLRKVHEVLNTLYLFEGHSNFDTRITLSIAATCEFLDVVIDQWTHTAHLDYSSISSGDWKRFLDRRKVENTMICNGWCPAEVPKMYDQAFNLATFYYYMKFKKLDCHEFHKECTTDRCQIDTYDSSGCAPQHRKEGCHCEFISVDQDKIVQILQSGSYPILQFREDENGSFTVEVAPVESGLLYVAISHVWADGLGNAHANSLPRCQLQYLRDLLRKLNPQRGYRSRGSILYGRRTCSESPSRKSSSISTKSEATRHSARRISNSDTDWHDLDTAQKYRSRADPIESEWFIWLDTFCCPVGPPEVKALSLTKMKTVYARAYNVLVIDKSLERYNCGGKTVYEALARIGTSSWVRRLWTLQESYLAKRTLMQFADEAIPSIVIQKQIKADLNAQGQRFRTLANGMLHAISLVPTPAEPELEAVVTLTRYRFVSVPSDEPLCLGVLLGLDLSAIVKCPKEKRMAKVWSLLSDRRGGIPSHIIFRPSPRLSIVGFRWAPKSLLHPLAYHRNLLLKTHGGQSTTGKSTSLGLKVKFPAITFSMRVSRPIVSDIVNVQRTRKLFESKIWVRGSQCIWYGISVLSEGLQPTEHQMHGRTISDGDSQTLAILFSPYPLTHNSDSSTTHPAVLGVVNENQTADEIRTLRSLAVVELCLLSGARSRALELAYQSAENLLKKDVGQQSELFGDFERSSSAAEYRTSLHKFQDQLDRVLHLETKDHVDGRGKHATSEEARLWTPCTFVTRLGFVNESFSDEQEWIVD